MSNMAGEIILKSLRRLSESASAEDGFILRSITLMYIKDAMKIKDVRKLILNTGTRNESG